MSMFAQKLTVCLCFGFTVSDSLTFAGWWKSQWSTTETTTKEREKRKEGKHFRLISWNYNSKDYYDDYYYYRIQCLTFAEKHFSVCVCVPKNDGNKDNVFRESKQQVNNNDDDGGDDTGYILLLLCRS